MQVQLQRQGDFHKQELALGEGYFKTKTKQVHEEFAALL